MKVFTKILLTTIFVALLACSIQSISADHLESGEGIFKDESHVNMISAKDSKYQVHVQVSMRDEHGKLVSIAETNHGSYLPHKITDEVFDTFMDRKEIITIDDTKYEKAEYTNTYTINVDGKRIHVDFVKDWEIDFCIEIEGHGFTCIPIFEASTAIGIMSEKETVVNQWTILREMN